MPPARLMSSVSEEAASICREAGIAVLDGGCPMMFLEPVDLAHRCIRWVLDRTGKLPDGSAYAPEGRSGG